MLLIHYKPIVLQRSGLRSWGGRWWSKVGEGGCQTVMDAGVNAECIQLFQGGTAPAAKLQFNDKLKTTIIGRCKSLYF